MRVVFTPHGWADYADWLTTDRNNVKRMNRLVDGDDLVILQVGYHYS